MGNLCFGCIIIFDVGVGCCCCGVVFVVFRLCFVYFGFGFCFVYFGV